MEDKLIKIKKIIDKAYNLTIENHPFIRFIIIGVISCWSIILTYTGEVLKLRNENGLTASGWIFTVGLFFLQSAITAYEAYKKKYETDREKEELIHENAILKTIQTSFDELCDEKSSSLLNLISNESSDSELIADPVSQLKVLLKKLEITVSEMMSEKSYRINSNEIRANMFFKFDDNKWRQVKDHNGYIQKDEVINGKSTFNFLINKSQRDIIFFVNKNAAFLAGNYIPEPADSRTKSGEIKGSIFGYKFARNANDYNIEVAIFCTTYNKTFIDEKIVSEEAVETMTENLKNIVLKNFEKRAIIELSTLYLKENSKKSLASSSSQT